MGVMDDVRGIGEHLHNFLESAKQVAEVHLPQVQALAEQASSNPAVVALLSAVHLPEAPELLASLAAEIQKIDQALADAKATAAAAATTAALAGQQAQADEHVGEVPPAADPAAPSA